MRDKRLHKLGFVSAALPDFNMLEVIKMLVQHFTSALAGIRTSARSHLMFSVPK